MQEVIELVGAGEYASRPIGELSGGEQQRLLIAQALVQPPAAAAPRRAPGQPRPPQPGRRGGAAGTQICREQGVTVLLVAHDVNPLLPYLDRVVYFAGGHAVVGAPRSR